MKRIALIALPLVAAIGLGAFFIMNRSMNAYLNVVPAEVTALARLDIASMAGEADLSAEDIATAILPTGSSWQKGDVGLDLSHPLYAFAATSGNFGIAGAVADDDTFAAFCESLHTDGLASAITRQRGCSWLTIRDQWLCAFDGSRVLVMGPAIGGAQDELRTEMWRLLNQSKDASVQTTTFYQRLAQSEGSAVAVVAPELLPAKSRTLLRRADIRSHEDALLNIKLSLRDNELCVDAKVDALTAEVEKQMEQLGSLLRPIQGDLLPYSQKNNLAWLGLNVEGDKLLELLRSVPPVRTALMAMNMALDFDKILSAIDGDMALEVTPDFNPSKKNFFSFNLHGFNLQARLKDDSCFNGSSSWGNSFVDVAQLASRDYSLGIGPDVYYIGAADNILYFGSRRGLVKEGNGLLQSQAGSIKGARLFLSLEPNKMLTLLTGLSSMPSALRQFERATLELDKGNTAHLRLIAPEGTKIAKAIFKNE